MTYKLKRIDGNKDFITINFENYNDAYDFLKETYGEVCCSDTDYDIYPYYDIVKTIET